MLHGGRFLGNGVRVLLLLLQGTKNETARCCYAECTHTGWDSGAGKTDSCR